ncbi:unnamed protein product, partial [Laminaria digitata]
LKHLNLGEQFNQPLSGNALPTCLEVLNLWCEFNHSLSGSELPDGLEVLVLSSYFEFWSSIRWTSGLKQLRIGHALGGDQFVGGGGHRMDLPPNLEFLLIGDYFNLPLTTVAWPPTLKVLNLARSFNHPIGATGGDGPLLPDGLEVLELSMEFNRSFEHLLLPVGLKSLIMSEDSNFDQGVAGVTWPPGVEKLTLGDRFNHPMEGTAFPETLRELSFGRAFTHSLQGVALPDGLMNLYLPNTYPVCHLRVIQWPRSLRGLYLGSF